jgi:hypothetical protein
VADAAIVFSDNTSNNSSPAMHGFLPKLSGSSSDCFHGDGTFTPCPSGGGGGGGGVTLTPPSSTAWTPFNTSGAIQSPVFKNGRWEWTTTNASSYSAVGVFQPIAATPYTRTFRIWPMLNGRAYSAAAVGWADGASTPGKMLTCGLRTGSDNPTAGTFGYPVKLQVIQYSSPTSVIGSSPFVSDIPFLPEVPPFLPTWFQLGDDGTNLTCKVGWDGATWVTLYSIAKSAAFLTPVNLVVSGDSGFSGVPVKVIFDSFN